MKKELTTDKHRLTQMERDDKKLPEGDALSLPKGWEWKKLGEIFEIKSAKRVHKKDWRNNGVPFYRAREIVKLSQDGFVNNGLFISREMYENYKAITGVPKKGDIIVSAVGTLGKCYLVKEKDEFYFKDASVLWFEKKENGANSYYIMYALNSDYITKQIMRGSRGATVGTLTISRAKSIQITLPPLAEQKRIVAILDEAFAAIDKAKANAEKNVANAKELFESYLNDIFANPGEDWEEKKLGDVCVKIQDGAHASPKKLYSNKGQNRFLYITSKNIRNNYIDLSNVSYCDKSFHDSIYPRCNPEVGDLLLTKDGANTGNITQNTIYEQFSLLSSVCLIKTRRAILIPEFLKYFIQSPIGFKQITGKMTGAAIKRIILKTIKDATITIPSISKQEQIVYQLNTLSSETKKLESIYQQKIIALDELKKSILKKAFEGEL